MYIYISLCLISSSDSTSDGKIRVQVYTCLLKNNSVGFALSKMDVGYQLWSETRKREEFPTGKEKSRDRAFQNVYLAVLTSLFKTAFLQLKSRPHRQSN